MRLTVQTDYALRMLMQLALARGLVTVGDVAVRYGISKNHLDKVAQALAREGFVETVRGRNGGLMLARPATEIQVGAVVRRLERGSALVECFPGGRDDCRIAGPCRLKAALRAAEEAFYAALDRVSIEDLVRRNPGLESLLGEAAA